MEFKDFLNEITKILLIEQERWKQKQERGECFNVFTTLGMKDAEVKHSAFLAELLSPKGSHGMGNAFLKEFFKTVGIDEEYLKECQGPIVERSIGTTTETDGGRIDIILEDGNHAVIIENKIYAGDQPHQLLRYHNYAKEHFPKGHQLLYLTLDGHEASESSKGKNKDVEYACISYGTEIIDWLERCAMLANNKPFVRETIYQYISLLKELTKQTMDKETTELKFGQMDQYPEAVAEIINNFNPWRVRVICETFGRIKKALGDKGLICETYNFTGEYEGKDAKVFIYKEEWKKNAIVIKNAFDQSKPWTEFYGGIGFDLGDWKNWKGAHPSRFTKSGKTEVNGWNLGHKDLQGKFRNWDQNAMPYFLNGDFEKYLIAFVEVCLDEIEKKKIEM